MKPSDSEDFERAADALCEVVFTMADVDLNVLHDDDVRALLDAKTTLGEMTDRYRHNQHATERFDETEREGGA